MKPGSWVRALPVLIALLFSAFPLPAAEEAAPAKVTMNDDLMARLIKFAREQKEPGSFPGRVGALFGLCDGSAPLKVSLIETERPEGLYLGVPLTPADSPDIVIVRKPDPHTLECYLTDKTYRLRAAAISHEGNATLILNEQAAEKFQSALDHLAREAAEDLPPAAGS